MPIATFRCMAGNGAVYASNASWATCRALGAGSASQYNVSAIDVPGFGGLVRSQNVYDIIRAFFPFNTAILGASAKIVSAIFSVYGYGTTNNDNNSAVALVAGTPASNTQIVNDDFDQVGSTRLSDADINLSAWSTAGYNNWTLNAAGIAVLNKTGVTRLALRTSHDLNNAAPGGANKCGGYTVGASDTYSPKLVVTYTLPSGVTPLNFGGGLTIS